MKSRSHFKFRQFSVSDDHCSMKVGTDAVLIGAWADLTNAKRVLDIGTGSGVIALIAAQRTRSGCQIDGVEIQQSDCAQAKDNAAASPWWERIKIVCQSIQDFDPPYQYDVILCNPPYFINSLRPPSNGRATARHTLALDHAVLVSAVSRLLATGGSANVIMPPEEGNQLRALMQAAAMPATRICWFRTRASKNIERVLMTFTKKDPRETTLQDGLDSLRFEETELQLYDQGNQWTKEYEALTGNLYLPRLQNDA